VDSAGGPRSRRALMQDAAEVRDEGRRILIYPEGHLAPVGARYPYKTGVFHLYKTFGWRWSPTATNLGVFWPGTDFRKRPGTAVLEFMEPIPPGLARGRVHGAAGGRHRGRTAELVAEARAGRCWRRSCAPAPVEAPRRQAA
jgi:1-acyl-sn-glycerol-3-phosphate acyltransferase